MRKLIITLTESKCGNENHRLLRRETMSEVRLTAYYNCDSTAILFRLGFHSTTTKVIKIMIFDCNSTASMKVGVITVCY